MRADGHARVALAAMTTGDTLRTMLAALRRVMKIVPVNTVAARRRIADAVIRQGLCFQLIQESTDFPYNAKMGQ